mmetsp:Transcript_43986/g.87392  ORF Transcript_43986/g.87392 Transcript_43986/m.87392 type:complete len:255 (-) Transcript_43986:202-966(-)
MYSPFVDPSTVVCPADELATPSKTVVSALANTRICKFYLRGKCRRGVRCTFAHGEGALQPQPDLYRTQLCRQFMQSGTCRFGGRCSFAHGFGQLRGEAATVAVETERDPVVPVTCATAPRLLLPVEARKADAAKVTNFSDHPTVGQTILWSVIASDEGETPKTPGSTMIEGGSIAHRAWSDSDFGDGTWATWLSEGLSDDDVQEQVETEVVVENTFVTLRPKSHCAPRVGNRTVCNVDSSRLRTASEPPSMRRQ